MTISNGDWLADLKSWLEDLGKTDADFLVLGYPSKKPILDGPLEALRGVASRLQTGQLKGHVYCTVNTGGTKADEITKFNAVFAEHDDLAKQLPQFSGFNKTTASREEYLAFAAENKRLSKEMVQRLIQEGALPEYSMCLDSGGRSLHWYWLLEDGCTAQEWMQIQLRLIDLLKSDNLKDASRRMRVPGFRHPHTGQLCRVADRGMNDDFEIPRYSAKALLELLPPTAEELRVAAGKEKQKEWLDAAPQPARSPRSQATFRFFENLEEVEKRKCAIDMLGAISRKHGREDEGGYVGNEIQAEFIYGLFREFRNLKDEEQLKMLESGFGAWNSNSHSGAEFGSWRKTILAKAHGQAIGTVIRFARSCGWDSKPWERLAGKDDASIVCQIIDDHMNGAVDLLFWNEAFYKRPDGCFYYDMYNVESLRKDIDDIVCTNFSQKAGSRMIDNAVDYLKDRCCPENADLINPDGWVLLKNGVLHVSPQEVKLYPYHADEVQDFCFLDAPVFDYKPDMDNTEADKLWECWGEGEALDLVQRIMGTALNISAIRGTGERTPGLFALGEGLNGKGMWEDILRAIFGKSACSGVVLQEFHQHSQDMHRAYSMYTLIGSRVNLPAENPCAFLLDKCETFRTVMTGEPMTVRPIRKDIVRMRARCINIFPLNDAALLNNKKANTRSRVRAVAMPYVYTTKPDPRDPAQRPMDRRYVYDNADNKQFWEETLLPGVLNRMIEGWRRAYDGGYPNEQSDAVIERMKTGTNPFDSFIEYSGVEVHPVSVEKWEISLSQMLDCYRNWLVETERGEVYGSSKRIRVDNPHLPQDRDAFEKRLKDFKIDVRRIPKAIAEATGKINGSYCVNVTASNMTVFEYTNHKTYP